MLAQAVCKWLIEPRPSTRTRIFVATEMFPQHSCGCRSGARDLVKKRTGSKMYPCLTGNKLLAVQTDTDGLRGNASRFGEKMWTVYIEEIDIWWLGGGGAGSSGGAIPEKN